MEATLKLNLGGQTVSLEVRGSDEELFRLIRRLVDHSKGEGPSPPLDPAAGRDGEGSATPGAHPLNAVLELDSATTVEGPHEQETPATRESDTEDQGTGKPAHVQPEFGVGPFGSQPVQRRQQDIADRVLREANGQALTPLEVTEAGRVYDPTLKSDSMRAMLWRGSKRGIYLSVAGGRYTLPTDRQTSLIPEEEVEE